MNETPEGHDATGCDVCSEIRVVRYAIDALYAPSPFCSACGREIEVRRIEAPPRPPRLPLPAEAA